MPKTCPICNTTYPDSNAFCPADGTTLRADETNADLIGTVIADRYLISKLLGEGGMGRVYLAGHVRLPQQAAIKVLHPSMVQDSAAVARFNREAANAARIEHDRVARVFDFGETSNGLVYLAMEFVPGRTLRDILEEQPRLPPARAANLIFQVAEGLDAAHRMSIVHRDLKPDNIMVITEEGGIDRSKVVDFGIAKVVDGTQGQRTQLTQAGSVIGTPEFMSPEQVFGEPLDARSDVYALALVGYQMFTGVLPFDSSSPERSLTARIVGDPRTLAEGVPEVAWPEALQAAFTRALAREPDARTASALDFADAVVAATEAWIGSSVLRTRTPLSSAALSPTPMSTAAVAPAVASTVEWKETTAPKKAESSPAKAAASPAAAAGTGAAPAASGSSRGVLFAVVGAVVVGAAAFFLRGSGSPAVATPGALDSAGVSALMPPNVTAPPANASPSGGTKPPASGGAAASAPATPSAPATVDAAPAATPPAAPSTAGAEEARRTLEAVKRALANAEEAEAPAVARDAIPQLQAALGKLTSSADSTFAYVYMVTAYGMADQPDKACAPLRAAKRLATTDAQLRAVANLVNSGAFTCAP